MHVLITALIQTVILIRLMLPTANTDVPPRCVPLLRNDDGNDDDPADDVDNEHYVFFHGTLRILSWNIWNFKYF
jgi:hypothetical protein